MSGVAIRLAHLSLIVYLLATQVIYYVDSYEKADWLTDWILTCDRLTISLLGMTKRVGKDTSSKALWPYSKRNGIFKQGWCGICRSIDVDWRAVGVTQRKVNEMFNVHIGKVIIMWVLTSPLLVLLIVIVIINNNVIVIVMLLEVCTFNQISVKSVHNYMCIIWKNERDEAAQLAKNHYGQEGLKVFLERIQESGQDLCVILTGYVDDMIGFFETSDVGLRRRFGVDTGYEENSVLFPDYNDDELAQIMVAMGRTKYNILISEDVARFAVSRVKTEEQARIWEWR